MCQRVWGDAAATLAATSPAAGAQANGWRLRCRGPLWLHPRRGAFDGAAPSPGAAQDWPTRTITLVVPFSPGGGVDISARLQAQAIGDILGQSVVVENIGGGAGMTAGVRVAHAAPDGYTFMIGNAGTHAFTQTLYKKPLYNSVTDFTPVGLVSESPRIVNVRKDLPVNDLQEFIAWLKANETTAQFGSAGVGTGTHLPCVLFNLAIGVNITHVPYRGAGPMIQDLIGGRIDYMCDTIQTGAQLAKQGTVKPVAVLSAHRVAIIPEVPTAAEQGLPGVDASVWNAFFLPKGTPDAIVRGSTPRSTSRWKIRRCARASKSSASRSCRRSTARRNISPSSCPRTSRAGQSPSTPPASARIRSLRGDVRGAGGVLPAPQLARDEGAEFARRAAGRGEALLVELRGDRGLADDAVHVRVEARDDLFRRARGGEQPDPGDRLEAGEAAFGDGRQVGEMRVARGAPRRQRPQRAGIDLGERGDAATSP